MRTDEYHWILLRTFYRSYRRFHVLLAQYEQRVAAFASKYGLDRRDLKLQPEELLSLFDTHALVALRNEELRTLREISHQLFRGERSDPFDNHATNIYHEVSILKEEEWTLREQADSEDPKEYERYYREVNFYYPKRLRHVRNLYGKAKKRLEKILPPMAKNTIVVRSAYLFGDELFADVYPRGLEEFYERLYPSGGAVAGFTAVADSFQEGGFGAEATEAYGRALDAAKREQERVCKTEGRSSDAARAVEAQRKALEKKREKALALP